MRNAFISLWVWALLPMVAGAWQDDALHALAARVVDPAQLSPMRMLSVPPTEPAPTTLADELCDGPLMEGFGLWQQEMPELLRRTAQTGDATLRSPHGFTALQAACLAGDAALIRVLVQAGALADAQPTKRAEMGLVGESPLSLLTACTALPVDEMLPLAQLLLEHGAAPDAKVLQVYWVGIGDTYYYHKRYKPLIFCEREWNPAREHNKLDLLLLQYGEQNYAKRFNPGSSLGIPWRFLSSSVIRRLLEGGADPNARPQRSPGSIPTESSKVPLLSHLVSRGDLENVQLALEHGARMNADILFFIRTAPELHPASPPDEIPYTPERAVEIARVLLAHGADAQARDRHGKSLLERYSAAPGKYAEALLRFFREGRNAASEPPAKK